MSPRWCSECSRWRPEGAGCFLCGCELGVALTVGAAVKVYRRRYEHGVYGPRPIAWLCGRVVEIQQDTTESFLFRVLTTRHGIAVSSSCNTLPLGAARRAS
jgi:hypothetical protein